MCGIFGYIGNKQNASQIVLEGLKNLEYRGYDSWGIASLTGGNIMVKKNIGKIAGVTLKSWPYGKKNKFGLKDVHISIGHTRWATHGGVTRANAHPHLDCTGQIAVLHNGIIENYQLLKEELILKGHKLISDTDTEIVAHLLEEIARDIPLTDAVRKTFALLKGMNAIVAFNVKNKEIVAAKNGSPLIVGIGDNEYLLSSDTAAILPYTKKVIFLKDNEMISLNSVYNLYSLASGNKITPHIETIEWNVEQAVKGKFSHFMLKEIHEQPNIINMIANTYTGQINEISSAIKKARGTFLIACGTAFNACLAGTYLFSKIASRHVNTAPASEFNYLEDFLTKDSLIIPLSQSGETIDVIEPLSHAHQKGSKIISITNVLGSTIYRMGDYKLLLGAGPEKAVASTKAYIAKLSILTLLAYSLAGKIEEGIKILKTSATEVERLLNSQSISAIKKIAAILARKDHIYIIGRGVSYATALEGALKIKEVSYIHTEGVAGGELKHGPIALISKGTPCIVIAPQDETYDSIISNAIEIKSRGGYIIGISSVNNPAFNKWIEVRETGSPLITQIIPLQLLSYFLAVKKNLDPDKPRNLAKSVTVK